MMCSDIKKHETFDRTVLDNFKFCFPSFIKTMIKLHKQIAFYVRQ